MGFVSRLEIEDKTITILATILKCEVDRGTSRQNTSQWDSLKHIEIVFALEEELGVEFSEKQMAALSSVSAIADEVLASSAA